MSYSLAPAIIALSACLLSSTAAIAATEWHNATGFDVEGRGWTTTESTYDRLPTSAKGVVPDSVWGLSHDSAGITVRFQTDSQTVSIRWTLRRDNLAMPHMPATGVSGVDLYQRVNGAWRFVGTGFPQHPQLNEASFTLEAGLPAPRELLLNLPLYNGVSQVEIGIPAGTTISKAAPRAAGHSKPIVIYGTSIVQGGCASRPGMAHTNIIGRMLDRPVIHLGFSGSGRMEPAVSHLLTELDPAVYVIDCIWNMGDLKEDEMASRVTELVRSIRAAHPTTPMLFVGQSHFREAAHPTPSSEFQRKAVAKLRTSGVSGLYDLSGAGLIGTDGEGTVDGCHPNDLGMMRQAEAIGRALRKLLR